MNAARLFATLAVTLVPPLAITPAVRAEDAAQTQAAAPDASLPAITVSKVALAPITDRVFASGLVGPVETVLVQPQIQGQAIDSVSAEVGDRVEKGQVLAKLSETELTLSKSQLVASRASAEAAVAQAEAQLVEARANAAEAARVAARAAALRKSGTASQASLDDAQAASDAANARVSVAVQGLAAAKAQIVLVDAQIDDVELKLKRTAVVAPVSGVIIDKNVMVGAIASSAGEPMFSIVKDGALELMADVAEQDILKLEVGQPAKLTFVGLAKPVDGKVRLVEPQVAAQSRLGRVRILDRPVRTGALGDVRQCRNHRGAQAGAGDPGLGVERRQRWRGGAEGAGRRGACGQHHHRHPRRWHDRGDRRPRRR